MKIFILCFTFLLTISPGGVRAHCRIDIYPAPFITRGCRRWHQIVGSNSRVELRLYAKQKGRKRRSTASGSKRKHKQNGKNASIQTVSVGTPEVSTATQRPPAVLAGIVEDHRFEQFFYDDTTAHQLVSMVMVVIPLNKMDTIVREIYSHSNTLHNIANLFLSAHITCFQMTVYCIKQQQSTNSLIYMNGPYFSATQHWLLWPNVGERLTNSSTGIRDLISLGGMKSLA